MKEFPASLVQIKAGKLADFDELTRRAFIISNCWVFHAWSVGRLVVDRTVSRSGGERREIRNLPAIDGDPTSAARALVPRAEYCYSSTATLSEPAFNQLFDLAPLHMNSDIE